MDKANIQSPTQPDSRKWDISYISRYTKNQL